MKVTNSTIPSSESSEETKRRRALEMSRIRDRLSVGDVDEQRIAEMRRLSKEEREGFNREDGVFFKSLETSLRSFNVERQAYHGGSFIGNHVHRSLKVSNNY